MNQSNEINEIAQAITAVQGALTGIPKDRTVKVKSKTGAEYSYKYATLDSIWNAIRPTLVENKLAIIQTPEWDAQAAQAFLTTTVAHESGQWVSGRIPMTANPDPQQMGSQITYLRRYGLSALLGITADEDDDAQTVHKPATNGVAQKAPPPAKKAPPAQPVADQIVKLMDDPVWTDDERQKTLAKIQELDGQAPKLEAMRNKLKEILAQRILEADPVGVAAS